MENIIDKILENESKRQKEIIGEFEFNAGISEELIGGNIKLGNIGRVKVEIYPEQTFRKPHIHIGPANAFNKGEVIVYLDKNYHWPHFNHQSILNKNQSKDFDIFMRSPYRGDKSITNWEFAVLFWNNHHKDIQVTITKQPDYTQLYKNIDTTNKK